MPRSSSAPCMWLLRKGSAVLVLQLVPGRVGQQSQVVSQLLASSSEMKRQSCLELPPGDGDPKHSRQGPRVQLPAEDSIIICRMRVSCYTSCQQTCLPYPMTPLGVAGMQQAEV